MKFNEFEQAERRLFIEHDKLLLAKLLKLHYKYYKKLTFKDVLMIYGSMYDYWVYTEQEEKEIIAYAIKQFNQD